VGIAIAVETFIAGVEGVRQMPTMLMPSTSWFRTCTLKTDLIGSYDAAVERWADGKVKITKKQKARKVEARRLKADTVDIKRVRSEMDREDPR
jgi:hypothetical protein